MQYYKKSTIVWLKGDVRMPANGGFPYSEKDFDDDDNQMLANMIAYTYKHLDSGYKENSKRLDKHDERLQRMVDRDKITKLQNQIQVLKEQRDVSQDLKRWMIKAMGILMSVLVGLVTLIMLLFQ